jgi:hypothetical protein
MTVGPDDRRRQSYDRLRGHREGAAPTLMTTTAAPEPERDPVSLCLLNEPLRHRELFTLDQTDKLTKDNWDAVIEAVHRVRDNLPANGKLTIMRMDPADGFSPVEVFSKCSKGKPSGKDTWNTTGSHDVRVWQSDFAEPLDKAMGGLANVAPAEPSPIMQTLVGVTWRGDFGSSVKTRKLVIVSDLVQHDPAGYSQLKCASWKCYQRSPLFETARADLRGIEVEVRYINRPKWRHIQTTSHVAFWRRVFKRFGTEVSFDGAPMLPPEPPATRTPPRRTATR